MPSGLIFDGKPKAQVARPAKRAGYPANSGFPVFDGYLMRGSFASYRSRQKSLEKMPPNQSSFVKSSARGKRVKLRAPLNFKGFHLDTIRGNSSVGYSLGWSKAKA